MKVDTITANKSYQTAPYIVHGTRKYKWGNLTQWIGNVMLLYIFTMPQ